MSTKPLTFELERAAATAQRLRESQIPGLSLAASWQIEFDVCPACQAVRERFAGAVCAGHAASLIRQIGSLAGIEEGDAGPGVEGAQGP